MASPGLELADIGARVRQALGREQGQA